MNRKIVLLLILTCLLITGCSSTNKVDRDDGSNKKQKIEIETDGDLYQTKMPDSEEHILKNISVKFEKAEDDTYVAFITNNNTFVIPDLEIKVNFYKNGKIVDTTYDGHDAILPGYTVVSDFESYEKFDDAKFDLSLEWGNDYKNMSADIKTSFNLNDSDEAIVSIKNNSDKKIDEIEIIAVFYDKKGNLLGTSGCIDIYDLKSNKTTTEKLSLGIGYSRDVEIGDVKVFLNQAHIFEW